MAGIWDQLVDCICRPPRDVYSPHEVLGGNNQTFMVGNMEATRLDFELTNKAGQKMVCSHYLPLDAQAKDGKLPVVVYCHCNSGSRRDAEEAVWHLLPCGVGVVAFDFTGSGLSDGKWVTLGAHEVDDLAVVIQHLRAQGGVSSIGLWGRSMGAVTALLYSHLDPDIAGMVLDSPFSRLTDLMLEIVVSQQLPIPKVMLKLALKLMRASVKRKAGADINSVSPIDVVGRSLIPAMFGHGEEDSFINIQHSVKLHEAYNSAAAYPVYKNLVRFKGDHNHPRPAFFYSSVCCFFHQQLKLDQLLLGGNPADTQQLMRHGSLNLSGEAPEQVDRANGFINTPWSIEGMNSLSDLPAEEALLMDAADEAAAVGPGGLRAMSSGSAGVSPAGSPSRASSSTTAAATGVGTPAIGSPVIGSPVVGSPADLNSPRAAGGYGNSRSMHAAAFGSPRRGFDEPARQQQRQHQHHPGSSSSSSSRHTAMPISSKGQRHSHVTTVEEMRAQLAADGFEVGSRGHMGVIPLPVAAGAPVGLSSSPNALQAGAAAGRAGAKPAAGGSSQSGSSSSGVRSSSPGPAALLVAGGQHLKRLLFRGSAAGAGAGTPAGVEANSNGSDSSSSRTGSGSAQQQHDKLGVSPPAAAGGFPVADSHHHRQQQQQEELGLLQPGLPAAPPGAVGSTWALAVDGDVDAVDPDLVAAIAASLQEQQQQQAAAAAAADSAFRQQQEQQSSSRVPLTPEEEEEMLSRAIALSLADVQQEQQGLHPLPLLQEQQSEHVSHLLLSIEDDELDGGLQHGAGTAAGGEEAEQQQMRRLSSLLPAVPPQEEQQQQIPHKTEDPPISSHDSDKRT